jgi:adenine-specific DNA-methyltransferase
VVVISGSDEGWVSVADLADMAGGRGAVEVLAFDSKRYVGAQIGIHDPAGKKVGQVGRTRNTEYLIVAGPARKVTRLCAGYPMLEPRGSSNRQSARQ